MKPEVALASGGSKSCVIMSIVQCGWSRAGRVKYDWQMWGSLGGSGRYRVSVSQYWVVTTAVVGWTSRFMRLSTGWITLRVHDVGKNLAVIFLIVTTSILVSK